jgi:hypothetical protein
MDHPFLSKIISALILITLEAFPRGKTPLLVDLDIAILHLVSSSAISFRLTRPSAMMGLGSWMF